jgi:flavin reductase (DIM6/NTAB) family NADH-FMN oxidoreductase RutF
MGESLKFDPSQMEHPDIYKVLSGVVIPRPIAWVSTMSAEGVPNVAPYSFFQPITPSPPHISFSAGSRDGVKKDTQQNIEASGEFVVNIANSDIARRMAISALDFTPEQSEFEATGLTLGECDVVSAPRVAEAPASLECQLRQMIPVGDERYGATLIIGEVVRFHVRDDLVLENYRIDFGSLDAVGRLAGDWYCATNDQYELPRSKYLRELADWFE